MDAPQPPREFLTAWPAGDDADPDPDPQSPVTASYILNLDIGETDAGHHLIVRSIALTDDCLLFEYEYRPERTEDERSKIWPNISYDADVTAPGWHTWESEADVYPRPVPEARYAWFDFYPTDYEWMGSGSYRSNLPHRVARLTFDLHTGEARVEH